MKKTKIEWCDSTWNPVTGCYHECEYCYARGIANRFGFHAFEPDINERVLLEIPVSNGRKVPYPFDFAPTFHKYRLNEPKQWTKPRTIFVCSMADLFGNWVPDGWIDEVFKACEEAPQHRYLFLTKNPERLSELANAGKLPKRDNWWYGSTVDDKQSLVFYGGIEYNTFISIEPLLENLDVGLGSFGRAKWIIIGAETGNRKGKIIPEKEWIDNICDTARVTNAAVFMKDSLIPIVSEENMRREFPWEVSE